MADQVPCPKTYELHGGVMALQPEHNCPPYLCCLAASALILWLWAGKQAVYDVYDGMHSLRCRTPCASKCINKLGNGSVP